MSEHAGIGQHLRTTIKTSAFVGINPPSEGDVLSTDVVTVSPDFLKNVGKPAQFNTSDGTLCILIAALSSHKRVSGSRSVVS